MNSCAAKDAMLRKVNGRQIIRGWIMIKPACIVIRDGMKRAMILLRIKCEKAQHKLGFFCLLVSNAN
jgi:hypothetical protein